MPDKWTTDELDNQELTAAVKTTYSRCMHAYSVWHINKCVCFVFHELIVTQLYTEHNRVGLLEFCDKSK